MSRDPDAEKLGFCADCPDHEGCATGYSCSTVKMAAATSDFRKAMAKVAEAAMTAGAALSTRTVSVRPRVMGGMEGDIVQHVSTTVAMSADRQMVEKVIDEAEVIIRDYANTYGYRIIGAIDARSRVRNDSVPEVEVIVEARLRPRHDGIWGEIREAIQQDKDDLEAARGSKYAPGGAILSSSIDASMITVGTLSADTLGIAGVGEPDWSWNPPSRDYAVGTMTLNSNGDIYRYDGSNWIWVATSTVN